VGDGDVTTTLAPRIATVGPGAVARLLADALAAGVPMQLAALEDAEGPVSLSPGAVVPPGGAQLYVDAESDVDVARRPAVRVYAFRMAAHRRGEASTDGNFRYEARYTSSLLITVAAAAGVPGLVEARYRLVLACRWALVQSARLDDSHRLDPNSIREDYYRIGPGGEAASGMLVADARLDVDVTAVEGPSLPPAGLASTFVVVTQPMTEA